MVWWTMYMAQNLNICNDGANMHITFISPVFGYSKLCYNKPRNAYLNSQLFLIVSVPRESISNLGAQNISVICHLSDVVVVGGQVCWSLENVYANES